jgi:hypothetical protein
MTLLDEVAAKVESADLVILSLVESIRGRQQSATNLAIAAQIRGAPPRKIAWHLSRMVYLGLAQEEHGNHSLTMMGAELLARNLRGWTPSPSEQRRRDHQAHRAATEASPT